MGRVRALTVVASLPAEDEAEFLLIASVTRRDKDNTIELMLGRCDRGVFRRVGGPTTWPRKRFGLGYGSPD